MAPVRPHEGLDYEHMFVSAPREEEMTYTNETDIRSLALERLEMEISELAAHIHAATCRWLMLVAELDRREGYLGWGCRSCADWLSVRCGIALGAAREQVRVAGRLAELPLVREAFGAGRLSYSKVRAISRVADSDSEAQLVELGLQASAAQLERIVRAYRRGASASLENANAADAERFLSCSWDDEGCLVIRGRVPAEDGELLLRALHTARDPDRPSDVSAETSEEDDAPTPVQSNADALVSIAEASLASQESTRSGGDRCQVVLHMDANTPGGGLPETAGASLDNAGAVCIETAERIACDTSLVVMSERNGQVTSVGRKTRTVPPALRRALRSRDRCCRFPGCTQRRFVDAHHIHHWAHGGETALENMVLLCRRHHRLLHEGGYRMERRAGRGLDFKRPDGRAIQPPPRRGCADDRNLFDANRRAGLELGPTTPVALSNGERFSLDLTVGSLLASASKTEGVSAEASLVA